MSLNPWDSGSLLYRRLLLTGMACIGLGMLSAVIAALGPVPALHPVTLTLIGAGLLTHVLAQVVRFRDARRRRAEGR